MNLLPVQVAAGESRWEVRVFGEVVVCMPSKFTADVVADWWRHQFVKLLAQHGANLETLGEPK
jgi:hypothetical protein